MGVCFCGGGSELWDGGLGPRCCLLDGPGFAGKHSRPCIAISQSSPILLCKRVRVDDEQDEDAGGLLNKEYMESFDQSRLP
jgi:hypothetical protein